jgi:hypothetical protein
MTIAQLVLSAELLSSVLIVFGFGLRSTVRDATTLFRYPLLLVRSVLATSVLDNVKQVCVSHDEIIPGGRSVAVFGEAGGTIAADGKLPPENKWRASAAWLAIVENGLVKQWRVYADNNRYTTSSLDQIRARQDR